MSFARIAALAAASFALCPAAGAQTHLITFEEMEARGAISEIVRNLPGCVVPAPRGSGGSHSALVDIDCSQLVPPGPQGPTTIIVRLFSRMVVPVPWVVQDVTASYSRTSGAGASVIMTRPAAGTTGRTRNAWVEFEFAPTGRTQGTVRVNVTAMVPGLPPALPHCPRSGVNPIIFDCATQADCSVGYRCAPECANTCVLR